MTEVKSFEQLSLVLSFLIPGLVTLYVRSQFLTGRMQAHKDALLTYFAILILWWGICLPILDWTGGGSSTILSGHPVLWFLVILGGPALFGGLLGLNGSKGWTRNLFGRFGFKVVHVIPSAWDWKFAQTEAVYVLIILKDGTRHAGFCGQDSFISSDPQDRDIYIQRVYDLDSDDKWIEKGEIGLLVRGSEICSIEFFPYKGEVS